MKKLWNLIVKDLWMVLLDVVAVNAAYFIALLMRFYVNGELRGVAADVYLPAFWKFAPFYTVLAIGVFCAFRLYGGMWTYSGLNDMNRIIGASVVTTVIQVAGSCLFVQRMPITYYVIGAVLQFFFLVITRFGYRLLLVEKKQIDSKNIPTVPSMIVGAGEMARQAIRHLEDTPFRATVIVDEKNAGKTLDGIPIRVDFSSALRLVSAVFIADPGLSTEKRKEIREKCEQAGVELRDYTGYLSNLGGSIPVSSLLEMIPGPVTLILDGQEQTFPSGEQAIVSLKNSYEIKSIENARMELVKPSLPPYVNYDAWAQQHKEHTGEDVSFF